MSESTEAPFLSWSILKPHESSSNQESIPPATSHFAYESLCLGCHSKYFEKEYKLESAQKWITFSGNHHVEFPLQTLQPKVQMPQRVPLKELPRDVEIDRRLRQFSRLRISQLLHDAAISSSELIQPQEIIPQSTRDEFLSSINISLHFFDDDSFDTNTISGWLDKGLVDGVRHPVPAWALIKNINELYSWEMVAVYGYDEETFQFFTINLEDGLAHQCHRIHLMFMAENPYCFLERIKSALKKRNEFEAMLRYQFLLDSALLDIAPEMNQLILNKISNLALIDKASYEDHILESIFNEIRFHYQRIMVSYELHAFLHNHSEEFPLIRTPRITSNSFKKPPHTSTTDEQKRFEKSKKSFRMQTLFYTPESIQAMLKTASECINIESFSLFTFVFTKAVALPDFVIIQESTASTVIKYLKYTWPENLSAKICLSLRSIAKGWLDLSVSDWNVFKLAKISRFFVQAKLRMQESVQVLMQNSIVTYSQLLNNPCQDFLDLKSDYIWTNDLLTTPFNRMNLPPVFKLVLQLCSDGPFYSTDPKEFEPTVTQLLYTTLTSTSGIRLIEPDSLLNLSFAKNLYIFSVELIEDPYIEHVNRLHSSYSKAVIPLNAYLEKYKCFIEFHEMSIDEFIRDFAESGKSSEEVKNEIIQQRKHKEELKLVLPDHIVIGPFDIIVEPLKIFFINKRNEIIHKLFAYYLDRMLSINTKLLEDLFEISEKLHEKLWSVERLFEMKHFMLSVPDKLAVLRERIQKMMTEYDLLDTFFYNLSDQQLSMKWEAFGMPNKITERLIAMNEEHKVDIEEFKKKQVIDLASFQQQLESLNDEIMKFSLQFDPEKALEVAVEAKKIWKVITNLKNTRDILKHRQILLEADELPSDYLQSMIQTFNPYRTLWTACFDFIKLEEIAIGNPLVSIDLNEIKETLDELSRLLEECVPIFSEKSDIQNVAIVFLQRIQQFSPIYETIKRIKNEHWLLIHWQEFAQRSGIDIKYSLAMNFTYCIKKGILNHVQLVKEIAEKAVLEAENIRLAMEEEQRLEQEAELALIQKKNNRKCRTDIL